MSSSRDFQLDAVPYNQVLDTCFRIISAYRVSSDDIITRIDIKIGTRQYAVGFASCSPIAPKAGDRINISDDLMTPSSGIMDCLNIKVSKIELIKSLEELISDLKNDGIA